MTEFYIEDQVKVKAGVQHDGVDFSGKRGFVVNVIHYGATVDFFPNSIKMSDDGVISTWVDKVDFWGCELELDNDT